MTDTASQNYTETLQKRSIIDEQSTVSWRDNSHPTGLVEDLNLTNFQNGCAIKWHTFNHLWTNLHIETEDQQPYQAER